MKRVVLSLFSILTAVAAAVIILAGLELGFRLAYGPIRAGFIPTDSPSLLWFRGELPWCRVCDLGKIRLVTLGPKKRGEIRVIWVGEPSVATYPLPEWTAPSILDFLLRRAGARNVTVLKMAQGGAMSTEKA